jgi:bacillolysin
MMHSTLARNILTVVIGFSLINSAFAQPQNIQIRREASSNRVASILVSPAPPSKLSINAARSYGSNDAAKNFLAQHAADLGVTNSDLTFSLVSNSVDDLGMNHARFSQNYKNIPIFGAQVLVHSDQDSQVRFANGSPVEDIKIDSNPKLTSQNAIYIAKQLWGQSMPKFEPEVLGATLYIWNRGLLEHLPSTDSRLVWQIHLYHSDSGSNENYFIDAHSGELVDQITGKNDLDREVADCSYGDGICRIGITVAGYVYGRPEGSSPSGPNPLNMSRLDWAGFANANSGGSLDTDHIYDILGNVHTYYATKFGLNGANNAGGIGDGGNSGQSVPQSVTWAHSFINWDSSNSSLCPNAFFSVNRLNFCLGISTLDVVAHEYAHAVQNYSIRDSIGQPSGLVYSGEQGALNEGHSDIFGEAVENFVTGSGDWLIGEGTVFTRSLSDPTSSTDSFGHLPDRFYSPFYYCGASDHHGVHHNLGVFTKLAYLISEGGTFNGCIITGIGRDKEERIIYRAVNHYFGVATGFNAAQVAINQACADLYNADECANVAKALLAVEMDQAGKCSAQPEQAPNCAMFNDQCPTNPNKIAPGICGCDTSDIDSDGDGTPDCLESCPNDPAKTSPGICGCGVSDEDKNANGILDCNDIQVKKEISSFCVKCACRCEISDQSADSAQNEKR